MVPIPRRKQSGGRPALKARALADIDPIERARRLRPMIEAAAPAIEQSRSLPQELRAALHGAGLFRLLLPRKFGGEEVEPATFVTAVEEIAKSDASTAWCVAQGSGCSIAAAYLEPDVARGLRTPTRCRLGPGRTKRQGNRRRRRLSRHGHMALRQRQPPLGMARRPLAAGRSRGRALPWVRTASQPSATFSSVNAMPWWKTSGRSWV